MSLQQEDCNYAVDGLKPADMVRCLLQARAFRMIVYILMASNVSWAVVLPQTFHLHHSPDHHRVCSHCGDQWRFPQGDLLGGRQR